MIRSKVSAAYVRCQIKGSRVHVQVGSQTPGPTTGRFGIHGPSMSNTDQNWATDRGATCNVLTPALEQSPCGSHLLAVYAPVDSLTGLVGA